MTVISFTSAQAFQHAYHLTPLIRWSPRLHFSPMRPGPSPFLLFRTRHPQLPAHSPHTRPERRHSSTYHPNPENLSFWQRLRPAVPTVLAWTIITSLAAQILNARHKILDAEKRVGYQVNVLNDLWRRVTGGEELSDLEVRRELELAGLRERRVLPPKTVEREGEMDGRRVGWKEALLGRNKRSEEETRRELEECEYTRRHSLLYTHHEKNRKC